MTPGDGTVPRNLYKSNGAEAVPTAIVVPTVNEYSAVCVVLVVVTFEIRFVMLSVVVFAVTRVKVTEYRPAAAYVTVTGFDAGYEVVGSAGTVCPWLFPKSQTYLSIATLAELVKEMFAVRLVPLLMTPEKSCVICV